MNKYEEAVQANKELPYFAYPGGYPIYYVGSFDVVLCPKCASKVPEEVRAHDIHWEGESMNCDNCDAEIESAYGIPEED